MYPSRNSSLQSTPGAALHAFSRALTREVHILKERPELLWQQLYNRQQWEDGDQNGPISKLLSPEAKKILEHLGGSVDFE